MVLLLAPGPAWAQVSFIPASLTVTQNLNTLPTSGSATFSQNSTIAGIYAERTGTGTNITANNGSSNAGALYSYGTGTDADRALGSIGSSGAAAGSFTYGYRLKNETGSTITSLRVQYTGEQWRNSAAAAQTVAFSYLVSSAAITTTTPATALPAGYNAVTSLDFTSPITAGTAGLLDGNAAANQSVKDVTFSVSIPDGSEIMLRFYDPDHTGSDHGLSIDDLKITAVTAGSGTPVATLSTNPTTLSGYAATQGTVSNTQTYTLTGSSLGTDPVSVSATTGVELSTDNSSFTSTLSLPTSASAISQVVYARLTNAVSSGAFSGTITNTANTTLTAAVTVSGQVNAVNSPTLSASPTALSGFSTPQGTASAEQTYTLTASNLTNAISVSAPTGVEVSQTTGSGFGSSLTFPSSTTSAVVYARLMSATATPISGTITNVSGGLTANVTVSGVVSSTNPYTSIATARAGVGQTFLIQGRVTVTNQLGARQIYIQDRTGGIVVYSSPSGADLTTLVQLGDSVQARGPISIFNGFTEITSPAATSFTVVSGAGTVVPTPVAITPDQLANYQGQLVSIANASITPVAATFSGGTSYTVSAGGQSGVLRISANSPLSGAGQPSNPVSVTGIADRFVSGATTAGANGLQLQPRILADIPGSTPATDQTCTVGNGSSLTRNQTLDIAAWNMEFFGADGGTISCPPNKTLTYNDMGPVNEDLQQTNAAKVLTNLNADIIAVEEVSDINRFDAAVKSIPGSYSYVCSDKFSYFFQDECDQVPSGNPATVFGPTKFAQKVCVIYNMGTVTPVLAETKPLLFQKTADYTYPGTLGGNGNGSGWASGRLPFLFVANVTINGVTKKVHVVALHAKSGSAKADFDRRVKDYNDLKAELDANYPTANVVILGDYNDKATTSIYTGSQVSSFNSFITDASNYNVITTPLEQNGCATYNPSGGSFIDHITISNDLQPAYVTNTAYVLQPFSIPNYTNTTSDHSPIEARFDISQLASPVTAAFSITGVTTVSCTTLSAGQRQLNFTPQYAGVNGQPISFSVVNELLPTTAPGPYTLNLYIDNPTITLKATQTGTDGEASFAYNWLSVCNGGGIPPVNTAPTTTGIANQTATVNQYFSLNIASSFSDSETPNALVYTAAGLPAGLSLMGSTISGTPSMSGVSSVTVTATDPGSLSVSTPFSLTVNPAVVNPNAPFSITGVTTVSCTTLSAGQRQLNFTPQYAGVNGQPITFQVINEMVPTTAPGPYTLNLYIDNPTITLKAAQAGTSGDVSYSYNWLSVCNGGENTPPPVNNAPFSITGVTTVSCTTLSAGQRQLQFTPRYAGVNGQPVSFSVVNEMLPTTNAGPYTLNLYTDNPTITLKATQAGTSGEASYTYNWLSVCGNSGSGRIGSTTSAESALQVRVIGNPAQNGQVSVEVRGAAGQPLRMQLTDMRGQIIGSHQIEQAGSVERHTFEIGRQSTGLLLLRATTSTQSQTVKVIKAD